MRGELLGFGWGEFGGRRQLIAWGCRGLRGRGELRTSRASSATAAATFVLLLSNGICCCCCCCIVASPLVVGCLVSPVLAPAAPELASPAAAAALAAVPLAVVAPAAVMLVAVAAG